MTRCLALLLAVLPGLALAQFPTDVTPPGPAQLFSNQCGVCHVLHAADGKRQGPPLGGVIGRKPGSVEDFKYSAGYGRADFVWDAEHLDRYLANPQGVILGSTMAYRQAKAETRAQIIAYLEEQH